MDAGIQPLSDQIQKLRNIEQENRRIEQIVKDPNTPPLDVLLAWSESIINRSILLDNQTQKIRNFRLQINKHNNINS